MQSKTATVIVEWNKSKFYVIPVNAGLGSPFDNPLAIIDFRTFRSSNISVWPINLDLAVSSICFYCLNSQGITDVDDLFVSHILTIT